MVMPVDVILIIVSCAVIISLLVVFAISNDRDVRNKYIEEWRREREKEKWDGKDRP